MRKILRWLFLIVFLLAVAAAIVYAARPQAVPVDTETVVTAPMRWTVDEEGKTRIRERYVVSSPLMGRLQRITLNPGDQVLAEQTVLAVIEPTDPELLDPRALAEAEARVRAVEATVRQSEANLERTNVAYDFAVKEHLRMSAASEEGAASPLELDQAVTNERLATEERRASRFSLEIAQYELEVARSALLYAQGAEETDDRGQMPLRSPISGAILRVFQESVAVVTPGIPLIEVGDPRDLEIVIDVLSSDGVKVSAGDRVIIDEWGGEEPLEGIVRLVEPSAFTKISALGIEEQRVNVIADFVSPPESRSTLGDAFRVEASIVVWEEQEVLQIPTSAAFRDGKDWAVFLVIEERAVLRRISVGRQNGRAVQVLDGLIAGDIVVLHPSDKLDDGLRVVQRSH